MTRRTLATILLCLAITSGAARADDGEDVTPAVELAVEQGLAFLGHHQQPDGAIRDDGPAVATTGLSLMCYLGAGHVPDMGRFGPTVTLAVDHLLASIPDDAYIGKVDGSRMYGQAIIALALAEVVGVEPDPARKARLTRAVERLVRVILDAQDVTKEPSYAGGWRYEPQSIDSDLSLSAWSALAMRAATDIGVDVPADRAHRAAAFVARCFHPQSGGFAYQPGGSVTGSMTGVGVVTLSVLDRPDRPEVLGSSRLLIASADLADAKYPLYARYYVVQGAHQLGQPTWPPVWRTVSADLLKSQSADGGWPHSTVAEEPGRVYATAMSVLTLTVPYRLLPIYQR